MACHCIREEGGFQLDVELHDSKTLYVRDWSNWYVYEGKYQVPEAFEVLLYVPGSSKNKPVSLSLKTQERNLIKISDVMPSGSHTKWPDGIYCFKAVLCDREHLINRLLLPKTWCCIKQYSGRGDAETLKRLQQLYDNAGAAVQNNRTDVALATIEVLKTELSILNCNC